ncbi:MAG: hypothetical protein J5736_04425 [Bacilli bacterium]|nr:hypothetical protein [Bacilli bacterium]
MILDSLIDPSSVTPVDALWISLLAIGIVIFTLVIVILITTLFQKGMAAVEARTEILPRKENKILSTDEDAVAAAHTAVIDFHKETGKDARIVSIRLWED